MFLDALDVTGLSDEEAASVRLRQYGFVFQQPMLIEGLSVMENILLAYGVQGGRVRRDLRPKAEGLLRRSGWTARPTCSRDSCPAA